ncbi:1400_t:CDS:1, partial [Entrophospora sp. SA101]
GYVKDDKKLANDKDFNATNIVLTTTILTHQTFTKLQHLQRNWPIT